MKELKAVAEVYTNDCDGDEIYAVKNNLVEKEVNSNYIPVGLFKDTKSNSFIKPNSLKILGFDDELIYKLEKNKPIIGIVEWPYFNKFKRNIYEIPTAVVDKVIDAGGVPVGIFPTQIADFQNTRLADIPELSINEKSDLDDVLNLCDAIIKPGAFKAYEFDKYIHHYTLVKDMPYLGICGGMQIMTYPNGKLENTNPNLNVKNIDLHASGKGLVHDIKIEKDSKLYQIVNKDVIRVNSHHKKCLPDSALLDAKVAALAIDPEYPDERVIEAIEIPNKSFQIGVQWHPEKLNDKYTDMLFNGFIEESNKYSKRK